MLLEAKKKQCRVTVGLSADLDSRLSEVAERYGVTKSAIICIATGWFMSIFENLNFEGGLIRNEED